MKKLMMVVAVGAAIATMTGCKSIEVERHAQSLATVANADGTVSVVRDAQNNPVVLDGGWNVDYFQHWNWQRFDSLHATAGTGVALYGGLAVRHLHGVGGRVGRDRGFRHVAAFR